MKAILVRFLLLLPILFFAVYFTVINNIGLPQTKGEIIIDGISSDVQLMRDTNGVVQVSASTDLDVFFGIGYAHAQDRLWQLELQRRTAQGRLSEVLGASTVGLDAQMRTLGLYQSVDSAWNALSPDAKASLTAYSKGINTWIKESDSLPPEFELLGVEPEYWNEKDSLAWSKVFALSLANNMYSEVVRFFAKQYLDKEQESELFSGYQEDGPITVKDLSPDTVEKLIELKAVQSQLQAQLNIGGRFVGSNAWAVSGKLTTTGNAILANDPHLGIQVPSPWYVASLRGNSIATSGMTLVGLPVIIFGRNDNIAWGGTSMMADVQDLYFEQLNSTNPRQYQEQGQWLDFQERTEYIKIKPEFPASLRESIKPLEIVIRETVRGPVIGDAFGISNQPLSLRWTALDEGDTSYESFYQLNYANDWSEFQGALSNLVAPALNFLYSDQLGNIGYQGAGRIPVRASGEGITPVLGGAEEYAWTGAIPFNAMPQSYNPASGFLVSANNKVIDETYPYHISHDWAPAYRAGRIEELLRDLLEKKQQLSVDDMKLIQRDTVSYGAFQLKTFLQTIAPETNRQREALELVGNWDVDMDIDSAGAAIFNSWVRHLRNRLFADELKASYGKTNQVQLLKQAYEFATYDQILAALTPGGANWCDDTNTAAQETCNSTALTALDLALTELTKLDGSDMEDWRWGEVHETVYSHTPFSNINLFKNLFERRIANGGNADTVNVSAAQYVESEGYEQNFGASFRQIMSLSENGVDHLFMNSTGQSGNVFSPHYDDMVKPFRDVEYFDFASTPTASELLMLRSTEASER